MTYWLPPHISKVYEAITAIADRRIELKSDNSAKCYSSSGNKFYIVSYDPDSNSIMASDNMAYYTNTIIYPMIALLMLKGRITYDNWLLSVLSNIKWKDINQKYKNNYDEAVAFVLENVKLKEHPVKQITQAIEKIYTQIYVLELKHLGKKVKPPKAY